LRQVRQLTYEEIDQAYDSFVAEPAKVASIVFAHSGINKTVLGLEDELLRVTNNPDKAAVISDLIHTAMAIGVDVGIRIGEHRQLTADLLECLRKLMLSYEVGLPEEQNLWFRRSQTLIAQADRVLR
jgi:hypothetical protein